MPNMRRFPVLNSTDVSIQYVDWDKLDNDWALVIHCQTLEELFHRGGLSPREIYINVNRLPITEMSKIDSVVILEFIKTIEFKA
jgi:hypothetical protein